MLAFEVTFGTGGNSEAHLRGGWSHPESGFTWSTGLESCVRLTGVSAAKQHIVMVDVAPFKHPPTINRQRVEVYVGDELLEASSIEKRTMLAFRLPKSSTNIGVRTLRFVHPDFLAPNSLGQTSESRPLALMFMNLQIIQAPTGRSQSAIGRRALPLSDTLNATKDAIESATNLATSDLLMRFESLGHTCEFGLLQQQFGADPLGLLRFTGVDTSDLIRGLIARYEGLGQANEIHPYVPKPGGEIWVRDTRYNLHCHTGALDGQTPPAAIVKQQSVRLSFLKRKFLDDVDSGEKIFVLKRPEPIRDVEAEAVFVALNATGPNALLWIEVNGGREPGTVEMLMPGFMRGHLDRLGDNSSPEAWLSVCANAYVLMNKENACESLRTGRAPAALSELPEPYTSRTLEQAKRRPKPDRRRIIIYGDCQAEGLYKAALKIPEIAENFDLIWHWVGRQHDSHREWREQTAGAHLLIMQDIAASAAYPMTGSLKQPGRTIMYPSLYFGSLWPFDDQFGPKDIFAREQRTPNSAPTFELFDSCLARLRKAIADPNLRYTAYRDLVHLGLPSIKRFFSRMNFSRLLEYETHKFEQMDVKYGLNIGRFILNNFRRGSIFHSATHPSSRVFVPLAFELFAKLDIALQPRRIDMEHLSHFEVPIHPLLARELGIHWATATRTYRFHEQALTFDDYVRKYIHTYG